MKIIFDNEKQKDNFFDMVGSAGNYCPSYLGLKDNGCLTNCKKCFETSGIECEIGEEKESNSFSDLELFIKEIAKFSDHKKEEYLNNRINILEKRCERYRKILEDEFGITLQQVERLVKDGKITPNDGRVLLKLSEIDDPNSICKKG